jgi:hypothetical protein
MFRMRHDLKKVHFHALCEEVKKQCAFELVNIRGAELLSEQIFERTGKRLSPSTLYRLLVSDQNKHVPYLSTLDILSDYAGHRDWTTFCRQNEAVPEVSTDKKIVPDTLGLQLLKICLDNHHFQSVIDYLKMLEGPVLPSWKMHLELGSVLGQTFRKDPVAQKELLPELARIPEGRFFFYEAFVDEDHLDGYYGAAIMRYHHYQFDLIDNQRIKDYLFGQCMLFFRALRNQDLTHLLRIGQELFSIDDEKISCQYQLPAHPVGRWHAYRLAYWHHCDQLNPTRLRSAINRIEAELGGLSFHNQLVIINYCIEILLAIGAYDWIDYLYRKHIAHQKLPANHIQPQELQLIQANTKIALLQNGRVDQAFDISVLEVSAAPYIQKKTEAVLHTLRQLEGQFL